MVNDTSIFLIGVLQDAVVVQDTSIRLIWMLQDTVSVQYTIPPGKPPTNRETSSNKNGLTNAT